MQNTLFTYKLNKERKCLQVIPTNKFYKQFQFHNYIKNTSNPMILFNDIVIDTPIRLECWISDKLICNDIGCALIQFYIDNIGKFISFNYTKHPACSYWIFTFKITNSQLLLELL